MWDAAKKDKEYQKVADLIEQKADMMNIKTLSNSPVKEYIGHGIERMSLIVKDEDMDNGAQDHEGGPLSEGT